MYLGRIVEIGPADAVYDEPDPPVHGVAAVGRADPRPARQRGPRAPCLEGDVPSPANPPAACRFHTRCPKATEICSQVDPPLVDYGNGHWAACHHPVGRSAPPSSTARRRARAFLSQSR